MTDEELIGYVLDPDDRDGGGAYLAADPETAARLDRLRAVVGRLEVDRDDPAPPPGLAVRTIARLAAHLAEYEPRPEPSAGAHDPTPGELVRSPAPPLPEPDPRSFGGRFRLDWVVAAGVGFLAVGLGLSFVGKARHQAGLMACQNNLRALYQGVSGYADTHAGQLPEVGGDPYPTAGSFVAALSDAGQYPPDFRPGCPAGPSESADLVRAVPTGYTYPLGYRTPGGTVVGLRRTGWDGQSDLLPVSADLPAGDAAPTAGPTSPHRLGQNVLYLGGHVRYTTSPGVGVGGDDIYRNQLGRVAAGLGPMDTVLGRDGDRP